MSKITHIHPCDENHQVVRVESEKKEKSYCTQPCPECPWRKDAPIGAFPEEAFIHSANTAEDMSMNKFGCHMAGTENNKTCAGFLLKGAEHNLAVRMALINEEIDLKKIKTDVDLYEDYVEMAIANGVDENHPALKRCRRK